MRTPFLKKGFSNSPKKTLIVGNDLTVSKRLHHHRIESFTRFFSKKSRVEGGAPKKRQPRYTTALQLYPTKASPYGDHISRI